MTLAPAHKSDKKFYMILGILFSLLYFFSAAGLFHHFHITLPIFQLPQLFCIIAILGVITIIRPLLTPFILNGFKIYAVLQGITFLLILTVGFIIVHHGGNPAETEVRFTWFPLTAEALTLLSYGVLLMAFWKLWQLRRNELDISFKIWMWFFTLFAVFNILGALLAFFGSGRHTGHLLGIWRILMLLNPLLILSLFIRELIALKKEEKQ